MKSSSRFGSAPHAMLLLAAAAVAAAGANVSAHGEKDMNSESSIRITAPRDGDVLNRHDGVETPEALAIEVRGVAPRGGPVRVNGRAAKVDGEAFSCTVPLVGRRTAIVAEAGDEKHAIEVWWDKGSQKRFRFSVDDNIEFLKDLGTAPDTYASLFDHWYLAFWRDMHETYEAKIHLNIYYQTDGFDLTQMPDKWKAEWQANADWLHLSFHALQDKPDRPYRNARYAQVDHDYDLVCAEIRRFAGNEVLSTTTTVHWAECPQQAVTALRDGGIETLIGLFGKVHGVETACYYLSPEQSAYVGQRPAWYDRETGVFFIQCAIVVNAHEVDAIKPLLDARAASPHTAETIELLIHEQYFRKELGLYQPTVMEKVRAALDWATGAGYAPVFWSEGFLGSR